METTDDLAHSAVAYTRAIHDGDIAGAELIYAQIIDHDSFSFALACLLSGFMDGLAQLQEQSGIDPWELMLDKLEALGL